MIFHEVLNGAQLYFDFLQKQDFTLHTRHWLKKGLNTFGLVDGHYAVGRAGGSKKNWKMY